MKLTSTGTASGGRECPFCRVPLVRIQTKDEWFVECPYNIKGDPSTCGFIHSELEYEVLQAQERQVLAGKDGARYAELKEELLEFQQKLDTVVAAVAELSKLKARPAGLNPEQDASYAELKEELQEFEQTLDTVVAAVAELPKLKARPAGLNPELDAIYAELKEELREFEQTLDADVAELSKRNARLAELKPGLNPELDAGIALHSSVVPHVFALFAGVLVGAAVAARWK